VTHSVFQNSDMMAVGKPSVDELALLGAAVRFFERAGRRIAQLFFVTGCRFAGLAESRPAFPIRLSMSSSTGSSQPIAAQA
jgi:hypothetical protein